MNRIFNLDMNNMRKTNQFGTHRISAVMTAVIMSLMLVQSVSAETRYRVKSSDNLNGIVDKFYNSPNLSRSQIMVGILAKNPRAFRGGNINFLLRGKRLTLPDDSEIQQISPDIASELLSDHARFFRIGLTGDFKAPTFEDLSKVQSAPKRVDNSGELLKTQTQKINQLQKESSELKKQLEELLNAKGERDNRLLELEKSLKQSNAQPKMAKKAPQHEDAQETKNTTSNATIEPKLEKAESIMPPANIDGGKDSSKSTTASATKIAETKTTESSTGEELSTGKKQATAEPNTENSLAKLLWLLPLALLAWFMFRYFGKKKVTVDPADDTIANYEAEYLEAKKDIDENFEEEALETSIKLDVARAYIEAEDTQSALDILTEIMEEGSDEQRQQAHELLESISPS